MTEFDFKTAERQFEPLSVRERAADAWRVEAGHRKSDLQLAALETVHEILGVTNGDDVVTTLKDNGGEVDLTIDNLRFRVEVTFKDGQALRVLKVATSRTSFTQVRDLLALGKLLATNPCYHVRPEADGRGSE